MHKGNFIFILSTHGIVHLSLFTTMHILNSKIGHVAKRFTRTTQNRVALRPCGFESHHAHNKSLAYLIGLALGDGNLSNPNGRAVRLRISCDKKYPELISVVSETIKNVFPNNKDGRINRTGCIDVYVYSNHLEKLLGWQWHQGPKDKQCVGVPPWIKKDICLTKECLRGFIQTDGCIYNDRSYVMVNFVNTSPRLATDVFQMIKRLGYKPNLQKMHQANGKIKHTIRLTSKSEDFIKEINLWKR